MTKLIGILAITASLGLCCWVLGFIFYAIDSVDEEKRNNRDREDL